MIFGATLRVETIFRSIRSPSMPKLQPGQSNPRYAHLEPSNLSPRLAIPEPKKLLPRGLNLFLGVSRPPLHVRTVRFLPTVRYPCVSITGA